MNEKYWTDQYFLTLTTNNYKQTECMNDAIENQWIKRYSLLFIYNLKSKIAKH